MGSLIISFPVKTARSELFKLEGMCFLMRFIHSDSLDAEAAARVFWLQELPDVPVRGGHPRRGRPVVRV